MKKNETIYDFYDFLKFIREKPEMYIGNSRTLTALRIFLSGVSVGQAWSGRLQDGEPSFSDFSAWFCCHLKLSCAGSGGWYRAILEKCPDDKKAFDRFFDYVAMYRQRTPEYQRFFRLTPAQRRQYSAAHRGSSPVQLRLTRYRGERCVFLHARAKAPGGWHLHSTFASAVRMRPYFKRVFGISETQWNLTMKEI